MNSFTSSGQSSGGQQIMLGATLLYNKSSKQILLMEAGKELVDVIMGFLTLPMGCVVKLLQGEKVQQQQQDIHGGSADHLDLIHDSQLAHSPKAAMAARRASSQQELEHQQQLTHDQRQLLNSRAGNVNKAVSMKTPSPSCPTSSAAAAAGAASDGFVKPDVAFMITNALEIFPSSTINSLVRLPSLRSEKLGDLDTLDIPVGSEEVLQLLKASMVSTNILNDVFAKYCKKGTTTY